MTEKRNIVVDMAIASILNNGKVNNEMLVNLLGTVFPDMNDALRASLLLTGNLHTVSIPDKSTIEYDGKRFEAKQNRFNFWENKVYYEFDFVKTRYFKNQEEADKFAKDGYLYGKDCKNSYSEEYNILGTYSGHSDSYCTAEEWLGGVDK